MKLLDDLKSILNAPAQTLKATELLTMVFTGRVLPDPKPEDKEKGK